MRLFSPLLCGLALFPAIACTPPDVSGAGGAGAGGRSGGGGAPGGASGAQGDRDSGFTFTVPDGGAGPGAQPPGSGPGEGMRCGFQRHQLERLAPELMLVLDRSSSMEALVAGSMNTRWVEVSAALIDVLTQTQGSLSWGVKSFPNPERCSVMPNMEVEISPSNQPAIDLIHNTLPSMVGSGTPTGEAVQVALKYLRARKTLNAKYMVLATDGIPACPVLDKAGSQQRAIAAVSEALAAEIPTFVIGIATARSEGDRVLVDLARAGGRARPGPQAYYPVENQKDLVDALGQIAKVVASCTFTLDKEPPSPDDVAVNVDGMRITRDPMQMNGWSYTPGNRSIVLHGAICERLKSGKVKDVEIIFGCPNVPIP